MFYFSSNSYHSNNMLFYCHLSPLKDNKLIISNHLVIIRGDNRVTIAIYHTFYCHLSPSYYLLLMIQCLLLITCYLLLVTFPYIQPLTLYNKYHILPVSFTYSAFILPLRHCRENAL